MQLIVRYGLQESPSQKSQERLAKALFDYMQRRDHSFAVQISEEQTGLLFQLPHYLTYELGGRIDFDIRLNNLSVQVFVTKSNRADRFHLNNLVRLVLQQGQPANQYNLKVHPDTGRLSCGHQSHIPNVLDNWVELLELAEEQLNAAQKNLQIFLARVAEISSQSGQEFFRLAEAPEKEPGMIKASLEELKKFVLSSSGYAWRVLRFRGRNLEKERLKKEFKQSLRNKSEKGNCMLLAAASKEPLHAVVPFFLLTDGDDKHISKDYIQAPQPKCVQDRRQIQQIDLRPQQLKQLLSTENLQLENGERLKLRKLPTSRLQKECSLIQELLQERYPTLPQYYHLKDVPESWVSFLVQKDHLGASYVDYLERNSKVLSLMTVLTILDQLARTVMHLRNEDIVSNSIKPASVTVLEGLRIQVDCLWNAYHSSIETIVEGKRMDFQETPFTEHLSNPEKDETGDYSNHLPYISHGYLGNENAYNCESSDVFSLGCMMYRAFFRRNIFDIKQSSIRESFEMDTVIKMCRKPVFAFDKFHDFKLDHMRLMGMFVLKTASHCVRGMQLFQEGKPTESCSWEDKLRSGANSRNRLIEKRPHLDWVVAILEYTKKYFQQDFKL